MLLHSVARGPTMRLRSDRAHGWVEVLPAAAWRSWGLQCWPATSIHRLHFKLH